MVMLVKVVEKMQGEVPAVILVVLVKEV